MHVKSVIENDLDIDAWVDEMIAERGYAQISMHGEDPNEPGYAFTIGNQDTHGAPELFCMGVAPDIAAQLFAICVEALADGRLDAALPDGDVFGLIEGFALRFRRLPRTVTAMTALAANQRYGDALRMVQIVLPDAEGRFPDDPLCNPAYVAAQDPDRLIAGALN
jgi:hypothetical protein